VTGRVDLADLPKMNPDLWRELPREQPQSLREQQRRLSEQFEHFDR
jgi:hypothetical protein